MKEAECGLLMINFIKMEEVKLTKAQEILFEVYDKGVQHQDCNLDEYVEKMKQALTVLPTVIKLRLRGKKYEKIFGYLKNILYLCYHNRIVL